MSLIDALTSDWDPSNYRDTYRDRVLSDRGQTGRGGGGDEEPEPETAPVMDLMMLRWSVVRSGPAAGRATPTQASRLTWRSDVVERRRLLEGS